MNTLKNIIIVFLVVLFTASCKNEAIPKLKTIKAETGIETTKDLDPNAKYAKAEFTINGMTCAMGCAKTIEKKIAKMEGVKSATVHFDRQLAMVEYNEAKVTPTSIEETVTKVADIYKVTNMKTVDAFSSIKVCSKDCCEGKTNMEKTLCKKACCLETASKDIKKACEPNCKKNCCAKKIQP